MALVLLVFAAILLVAGMVLARTGPSGRLALVPQAGAVLVVVGAVFLAWFVFSGDPYVNGATSRWSRRTSHVLVYAAWAASVLVAPLLWRQGRSRRGSSASSAVLLAIASAVVMLQAVAAASQDLN
jgi:hypothetical protein